MPTTILVIDDEFDIRFLYQEELESDGYNVITAGSGEEALEILSKESPDLITLDLKMPTMSGVDTLYKMKEIKPKIPVIVVTAFDHNSYETEPLPCEGYIVKSSDLGELKKIITKTLKEGNWVKSKSSGGKV